MDFNTGEQNIAICFFNKVNDPENQCLFTTENLRIIFKKKEHVFPVMNLVNLAIENKKLLMPVLYGGIIAPAGIIGFATDSLGPLLSLILILSGFFSLYYGWMGQENLMIYSKNQDSQFPLEKQEQRLSEFIGFINRWIKNISGMERYYFIQVPVDEVSGDFDHIQNHEFKVEGELFDFRKMIDIAKNEFTNSINIIIIIIDPLKSGLGITYQQTGDHKDLIPVASGKIAPGGIVDIMRMNNFITRFVDKPDRVK